MPTIPNFDKPLEEGDVAQIDQNFADPKLAGKFLTVTKVGPHARTGKLLVQGYVNGGEWCQFEPRELVFIGPARWYRGHPMGWR
jgi:hypothetical protein